MKQLFIILAALLGFAAPAANAQSFTGMWEIIPNYTSPSKLIETPEYVYVLAGSGLCGYDKQTGEVVAYNTGHRLNGNIVSGIWYDANERCLFVAYTDYNIDLLYDDGRTVNVPDLREAAITANKSINDVDFYGGNAYVGTSSGLLVIDMEHGAITESCLWGKSISHIAANDKHLLMHSWGAPLYIGNRAGSHHSFNDSFKILSETGFWSQGIKGIGPNTVVGQVGNSIQDLSTTNEGTLVHAYRIIVSDLDKNIKNIQATKDGASFSGNGNVVYVDKTGKLTNKISVPETSGKLVSDWNGTGEKIWIADANGFGQYDVAAQKYVFGPVKPTSTSGANVGQFSLAADGSLYMSTNSLGHSTANVAMGVTAYFDRCFTNDNIEPVNAPNNPASILSIATNPKNANEFVVASLGGLRRMTRNDDGTWTMTTYGPSNSGLLASGSNVIISDVRFDSKGNLFALNRTNGPSRLNLASIPADKWNGSPVKADWSLIPLPLEYEGNYSSRIAIDEANAIVISTAAYKGLIAVNYSTGAITTMPLSVDEDGMSIGGWIVPAITIDKKGWVWVGNDTGVYVVRDARDLFKSGFVPMRPKVPRNDGTNLADFLLENVEVYTIHVDDSDQKWIGTIGSGLYRVSADGTRILDHFTTENSDLPSDNVLAIHTDGNTNKVYIGTDQGLCIYHSTSAPASDTYENVYAYPNPVTPDYTGWITITGLMDNSTVKIADASGRVFFEGKSDGGLATWNGCDASGNRVKSGVYFVFASRSAEGTSTNAAVTKIVVIN